MSTNRTEELSAAAEAERLSKEHRATGLEALQSYMRSGGPIPPKLAALMTRIDGTPLITNNADTGTN